MSDAGRVQRESALRAAVLAGDVQAWQALYAGACAALYAYALWRCGGRADAADDVVQETWLIAVRRIKQFAPDRAAFSDWLRGIAANIVRNLLRMRRRRAPPAVLNGDVAHPGCDSDMAERIAEALAALPDHYEFVLRAKYVDRLTVAEIATLQSESVKAIESLLGRARQAFRKEFGDLASAVRNAT